MSVEEMPKYDPAASQELDLKHQSEFYDLAKKQQREMAELKKRQQEEMNPHVVAAFEEASEEEGLEKEKQAEKEPEDEPSNEIKVGSPENIYKAESIASQENAEQQQMIEEVISLIETEDDIYFQVSVNGSLKPTDNEADLVGQADYYYNKRLKEMVIIRDESESLDFSKTTGEQKFKKYLITSFDNRKELIHYVARLPFNPMEKNKFTKEYDRGSTHLSFALKFKEVVLKKLKNKKAATYLSNLDENDAKHFLSELFDACAKKYVPAYFNFYLRQREIYEERNKKAQ